MLQFPNPSLRNWSTRNMLRFETCLPEGNMDVVQIETYSFSTHVALIPRPEKLLLTLEYYNNYLFVTTLRANLR